MNPVNTQLLIVTIVLFVALVFNSKYSYDHKDVVSLGMVIAFVIALVYLILGVLGLI
jgi:hypothetical protein